MKQPGNKAFLTDEDVEFIVRERALRHRVELEPLPDDKPDKKTAPGRSQRRDDPDEAQDQARAEIEAIERELRAIDEETAALERELLALEQVQAESGNDDNSE